MRLQKLVLFLWFHRFSPKRQSWEISAVLKENNLKLPPNKIETQIWYQSVNKLYLHWFLPKLFEKTLNYEQKLLLFLWFHRFSPNPQSWKFSAVLTKSFLEWQTNRIETKIWYQNANKLYVHWFPPIMFIKTINN